jgi:uncharacterized protein
MSLPPNPLPEGQLSPAAAVPDALGAPPFPATMPLERRFPAWSGWDVLAIAVFGVFCLLVLIVLAVLATGVLTSGKTLSVDDFAHNPAIIRASLGGQAAAYLVVLVSMLVLVRTRAKESFAQGIEWNWPRASAAVFFVSGIALALAVDGLSRFLPLPKSLPIEDLFSNRTNAYLMAVFGISLAPLLEELFFRGLLYPVLRRRVGLTIAVLLTALGFAGIHSVQLGYAWAPILSIFVVGVVFTLIRQRWSSVGASFLMHCGYNFTLFALLWFASGHFRHLEKAAS